MALSWKTRLRETLQPILEQEDPRPDISAYHDMPFAIFHYPPEDELELRQELGLLKIRLEQRGKRVYVISLARCLHEALETEGVTGDILRDMEKTVGLQQTIDTIHEILASYQPLDERVAEQFPADGDPTRDVVFMTRAGSLFGVYRPYPLLEQLKGKVEVPAVLFYPGSLVGPGGLSFMGASEADNSYRPKIF